MTDCRNYGVDILRCLSLFGVVLLHLLGHGGVLQAAVALPAFSAAWLWEVLAYPAVDVFVLIAGFVGYREDTRCLKTKNLLSLWVTVLFYGLLLSVAGKLAFPAQVTWGEVLKGTLPVFTDRYWFFSCYVGVFLVSPLLHLWVRHTDSKGAVLSGLTVLFFSLWSSLSDPFVLGDGYSFGWFCLLYGLGGMLKKHRLPARFSKGVWGLLGGGAALLSWAVVMTDRLCGGLSLTEKVVEMTVRYDSPLMLIAAVCGVCLFASLSVRPRAQGVISFFAATTFSVYLIHDHPLVRRLLMQGRFAPLGTLSPLLLSAALLGCGGAIFLGCALIDRGRIWLFGVLRVPRIVAWADARLQNGLTRLTARLQKYQ